MNISLATENATVSVKTLVYALMRTRLSKQSFKISWRLGQVRLRSNRCIVPRLFLSLPNARSRLPNVARRRKSNGRESLTSLLKLGSSANMNERCPRALRSGHTASTQMLKALRTEMSMSNAAQNFK